MPEAAARSTGTVKWFNGDKGYGFVTTADCSDYFAHISQVQGDFEPVKNDRVEFSPDTGKDGRPFARRIVILNQENVQP